MSVLTLTLRSIDPEVHMVVLLHVGHYAGGFMDQEEFRKLAPTLIEEGLVRKGAERAADLAEAFSTIDRDDSGYIDLVRKFR